jgi:DNA-binding SARP family transcriptional activator/TolB-like protein/Tfp pilus assembly protein PilF
MLELRLLGGLDLRDEGGQTKRAVLAQPKRLALLAYLALAPEPGFCRRDVIAALLWSEQDQEHARGSLRQALRFLRRELGEKVIQNRGEEEIGLDRSQLWCDAAEFQRAVASGESADAARLYRGGLLEGFFITDASAEFEQWLETERTHLGKLAGGAFRSLAQRLAVQDGGLPDAIAAARQSARLDPDDELGIQRLLRLLDQAGDRAGAIAAYEHFAERLNREHSAQPSAETQRLMEMIRSRSRPHRSAAPIESSHADAPVASAASEHAIPPRRPLRRRGVWLAAAGAVLLVAGGLGLPALASRRVRRPIMTVAVLPARDLTGDTAASVLSEAVTDELISELAQIAALRVINRRTMMQYPDSTGTPERVVHDLGAGAVVLTTIQREGDSVTLRTQLVVGNDAGIAWAGGFSGLRHQVFGWIQEAARTIAERTRIELSERERAVLTAQRNVDPEAFEWYTKGRWWWNKRGRANLLKADAFFHQALDHQPTYALAWSGLADTYDQMGYGGFLPPEEAFGKAKAMARRALELDSLLAEPHAALGYALMYYDWDWAGAEHEFRLAIARNPSYATAHEWYGLFLAAMGRFAEAEREGKTAQELDPLSAAVAATRGWIEHYAGKEPEALQILRAGARTDSTNGVLQLYLGRVHQAMGRFDSATAHYAATGTLRNWIPTVAGEGTVAALQGRTHEARQVLQSLDSLKRGGEYVTPYAVALVHTALGEKDSAFAQLEQGYRERTHWMVWLNRDSRWSALRDDPRFNALVRKMGLPQ